jgi:hypothetical protein
MLGGFDPVQVATIASATVTATAAVYSAGVIRDGVTDLLDAVDENRERSLRNERLLLGGDAYPGVVHRVEDMHADDRERRDGEVA